jgi:hypothetical protein
MDPGRSLDWLDVEGAYAIRVAAESPAEAFLDREKTARPPSGYAEICD